MIQFCDKEVYTIYKEDVDRGSLFSFFCQPINSTKIICVFDNVDKFYGIITYDLLLEYTDGTDFIQREKVVLDKDIWDNAKSIFNQNKSIIFLPVFNDKDEMIYFCYNFIDTGFYHVIEGAFDSFERSKECIFIKEIYPQVQTVCIHGFNEWAFRFYNILKTRNMAVITKGTLWKEFGIYNEHDFDDFPGYSIMNIYSEGTSLVLEEKDRIMKERFLPCRAFNFLWDIARINNLYIEDIAKKEAMALKETGLFVVYPG